MKYTGLFRIMLMFVCACPAMAQDTDSINAIELKPVTVTGSAKERTIRSSSLSIEVADKTFLEEHFTGNLMQTLEYVPGVRSMDIGAGFSKPMIRGMAFNRITVTENGIKQEGQQWGADHGLEIDAFNVDQVMIRKGPSALLYGSDAMGGVIEISPLATGTENRIFGEVALSGKSVNNTLGGSLMLGIRKEAWYTRLRYSEQQYGDYNVPTDTIVYLTQRIPIHGKKLKNTAGKERNIHSYTEYRKGMYFANLTLSNVYQKAGFFPGAHGIPDASRVEEDGDNRNIDLPYSRVNHFKATTRQQLFFSHQIISWDLGYQQNHREEWSLFHTHYGNQNPPEKDPDKELEFRLKTYTSSLKLRSIQSPEWEYSFAWDIQYQQNRIDGYSFLLPKFDRFTTGWAALTSWKLSRTVLFSGGIRFDYGKTTIASYEDPYLETYLQSMGYEPETIEAYRWRSYPVSRHFNDFSASLGAVWSPVGSHLFKVNLGRSFRLPQANELASNGVHHGTFRHEQGDPELSSEQGWQLDASYLYEESDFSVSISPFFSWYQNYIYLKPTGSWSMLPHAGQIYRYTGAEVLFAGTEFMLSIDFLPDFNYSFTGEYVYNYNLDEHTPLSFSPPATMRNVLSWKKNDFRLFAEMHSIASQKRVAKNEDKTSGCNLFNLGGMIKFPVGDSPIDINVSVRNLLNTKYYNHLSFYRKVEIPEPGRNIQLVIRIPFNNKIN